MGAWYAVHVKPHREQSVAQHLTTRSVPAFLPLIEICRRYARRRVTLLQPLFPGYLFVHLAPAAAGTHSWNAVRWAPGVRTILGVDGRPVPVPNEAIETIQRRMHELGFIRPKLPFASGSRVWIAHGPLTGFKAIFDRPLSRAGRVRVLLELLGQQRGLELDSYDLEAV